ncbi:twin-arginine translocase TatA/TatE family subunit [Modestobacter sp. Leaf380]|uniref:twin-arginine translocase TatA/TatE family subunit n=1 Tax=Modestobacter sp. Leaf380 TaxID=1736356 RepID=UPI0006F7A108|nr:twin-arginine translocase TatA/TatE family subunit [Modestobacter sp. Leaf380]KQS68918.1 translocase [Modestobacter sp. Leaf380]
MFDSIGWGEIIVLGLAALFIFGPERLPSLAKDAANGLKRVREAVTGVRGQLHDSLGEDFDQLRDLDLRQYNPKTFLRQQLMGEDESPVKRASGTGSATAAVAGSAAVAGAAAARPTGPRDRTQPAPYDTDAT